MELTIKLLAGDTFSLSVEPCTTVRQLKSMIHLHTQVTCVSQRLSTQNDVRTDLKDDEKSLRDYGLHSGCIVAVLIVLQVFLMTTNGQTHTYDVLPGETVRDFKLKVQNKEQIAVEHQRLIYEGKQLEDGRKLEDYGVKAGSTITLVLRLRGG